MAVNLLSGYYNFNYSHMLKEQSCIKNESESDHICLYQEGAAITV